MDFKESQKNIESITGTYDELFYSSGYIFNLALCTDGQVEMTSRKNWVLH